MVVPAKPVGTAADLAVAYSPGVAEPCLEIARQPARAYDYTRGDTWWA
jgi:malate dehydrogenase (oxaloacetate-decarboxylating)(NADP+)